MTIETWSSSSHGRECRKPAIFGRAITRAAGGDVLRVRPLEGPCYNQNTCENNRYSRPPLPENP